MDEVYRYFTVGKFKGQLVNSRVQMVKHILFMCQLLIIILMIMPNRISIIVTGLFILKDMQF